ncbi:MAG: DUF4355 domain-containing protein [Pisciglobus halotolerans]|nr:DUF4355 domain-containing protein [Pisciglobus halotolerans]
MPEDNNQTENVEEVETEQVDTQQETETQEQEEMIPKSQMEEIIKQRVAREKKANEKAVEEAKRLAQMNEEERKAHEFEKLQEELAEYKKKDTFYSLSKEASKMLADNSIHANDELLGFIVKDTAEDTQTAVNAFVEVYNKSVEDGVKKALSGKAQAVNSTGNSGITKEQFDNLEYHERVKLKREKPDLYDKLKGE